ncbi:MAG: RDD family protein [Clostridia bacterium]|nr:RDD family protein [Clostridia bacterium]
MIGIDKVIYNENEVEKAPFIKRAIAYIIDALICFLLFLTGLVIFLCVTNGKQNLNELALVICMFAPIIYLGYKDFIFKGASIGKKLMRIKVIDKKTLDCPTKIRLTFRTVLALDFLVNSAIYFIYKESLSEIVTSTLVVSLPKRR